MLTAERERDLLSSSLWLLEESACTSALRGAGSKLAQNCDIFQDYIITDMNSDITEIVSLDQEPP